MSDKAVGGVCGALLTNLAGWLSGVFIPIDLIGGAFRTETHILPFYHSIETVKMALTGDFANILPHLAVHADFVRRFRRDLALGKTLVPVVGDYTAGFAEFLLDRLHFIAGGFGLAVYAGNEPPHNLGAFVVDDCAPRCGGSRGVGDYIAQPFFRLRVFRIRRLFRILGVGDDFPENAVYAPD
jgi:hypothetical protein